MIPTGKFTKGRWDLFIYKPVMRSLDAWEPWREVVETVFMLENSDIGEEYPEWRMYWVYGVVNLRIIGHVLDKVDAHANETNRSEIKRLWAEWKTDKEAHSIFWQFIENERNNILKTYKFGVEPHKTGIYYEPLDQDGIQLMREAAYWWRDQLEDLEERLATA